MLNPAQIYGLPSAYPTYPIPGMYPQLPGAIPNMGMYPPIGVDQFSMGYPWGPPMGNPSYPTYPIYPGPYGGPQPSPGSQPKSIVVLLLLAALAKQKSNNNEENDTPRVTVDPRINGIYKDLLGRNVESKNAAVYWSKELRGYLSQGKTETQALDIIRDRFRKSDEYHAKTIETFKLIEENFSKLDTNKDLPGRGFISMDELASQLTLIDDESPDAARRIKDNISSLDNAVWFDKTPFCPVVPGFGDNEKGAITTKPTGIKNQSGLSHQDISEIIRLLETGKSLTEVIDILKNRRQPKVELFDESTPFVIDVPAENL